MKDNTFSIAVIQASPVFMDREATITKACKLILEAADNGAKMVLLPEVFVPGYPDWIWNVAAGQMGLHQQLYAKLLEQSVSVPSDATDRLCAAARDGDIYVMIGINERNSEASGGSLYNTLLYIDPEGNVMGKHQKLVPTAAERTIWAYGDPSGVQVFDTPLCKVGGLTCWENYMPLARYSLYTQGVELYLAPTYDESETWQASMRHIAREGRTYVIGCCMVSKKEDIIRQCPELEPFYESAGEWVNTGNSIIVDPNGEIIAGPLHEEEGILYAEMDLNMLRGSKWNLDVAGHYARPDAFELTVRRDPMPIIRDKERQGTIEDETGSEKEK
ncbi:MAG: carbon-nitrogen hydrolase family protein [Sulfurimonadaceae bacterium]